MFLELMFGYLALSAIEEDVNKVYDEQEEMYDEIEELKYEIEQLKSKNYLDR